MGRNSKKNKGRKPGPEQGLTGADSQASASEKMATPPPRPARTAKHKIRKFPQPTATSTTEGKEIRTAKRALDEDQQQEKEKTTTEQDNSPLDLSEEIESIPNVLAALAVQLAPAQTADQEVLHDTLQKREYEEIRPLKINCTEAACPSSSSSVGVKWEPNICGTHELHTKEYELKNLPAQDPEVNTISPQYTESHEKRTDQDHSCAVCEICKTTESLKHMAPLESRLEDLMFSDKNQIYQEEKRDHSQSDSIFQEQTENSQDETDRLRVKEFQINIVMEPEHQKKQSMDSSEQALERFFPNIENGEPEEKQIMDQVLLLKVDTSVAHREPEAKTRGIEAKKPEVKEQKVKGFSLQQEKERPDQLDSAIICNKCAEYLVTTQLENIESKLTEELIETTYQEENHGEAFFGTREKQEKNFLENAMQKHDKDRSRQELQEDACNKLEDAPVSPKHPTNSKSNETEKLEPKELENIGASGKEGEQLEEQAITQYPENAKEQLVAELKTIPLEERKEDIESKTPENELIQSTCQEVNHGEAFMGTLCGKQQTSFLETSMQKPDKDMSDEELQEDTHDKIEDAPLSTKHPTKSTASKTEKLETRELDKIEAIGKEGEQLEEQGITQCLEDVKTFAAELPTIPHENRKEDINSQKTEEELNKSKCQEANHDEAFMGTLCQGQQTGGELDSIVAIGKEGEQLEEQAITQRLEDVKTSAAEMPTVPREIRKEDIDSKKTEEVLTKSKCQEANHDEAFMGTLHQGQQTGCLEIAMQKPDEDSSHEELQDGTHNKFKDVPVSPKHPINSTASETEKPETGELENMGAIGKEGAKTEQQAVTQFLEVAEDQFAPELTCIPVEERNEDIGSKIPGEEIAKSTGQGANHGTSEAVTYYEKQQTGPLETAMQKLNKDDLYEELQEDTCHKVEDVPVSQTHPTNGTSIEREKLEKVELENIGALGKEREEQGERAITQCPEDAKEQFAPELTTISLEQKKENILSQIPEDRLTKSTCQEANHSETFMSTLCEEQKTGYLEGAMPKPDEDKSHEQLQEDASNEVKDVLVSLKHPTNSTARETEKLETGDLENMGAVGKEGEQTEEHAITQCPEDAKEQFAPEVTDIPLEERKGDTESKISDEIFSRSTCLETNYGEAFMSTAMPDKNELQEELQLIFVITQCPEDAKEQFAPEVTNILLEERKGDTESKISEEILSKSTCLETNYGEAFMSTLCKTQQTGFLETAMPDKNELQEELQDDPCDKVEDVPGSPKHPTDTTASETEKLEARELDSIEAIVKEGEQLEEQASTKRLEDVKKQFTPEMTTGVLEQRKENIESQIPEEELTKSTCQETNHDESFIGTLCQGQTTGCLENAMQKPDEDKSHEQVKDDTRHKVEDVFASIKHPTYFTSSETETPKTGELENMGEIGNEGTQVEEQAVTQFPEVAEDQFAPVLPCIPVERRKENAEFKITGEELAKSTCQGASHGEAIMGTLCETQQNGFLETAMPKPDEDTSHKEAQEDTRNNVQDVPVRPKHQTKTTATETEKLETRELENIGAIGKEGEQLEEQAITQCLENAMVQEQFAPELTTIPLEQRKESFESHIPEDQLMKSTCQEANHGETFMGTLCEKPQTVYLESAMQKSDADEELQEDARDKTEDIPVIPNHPTNSAASKTEKPETGELESIGAIGKEGLQMEEQAVTQFPGVAKDQFVPELTSIPVEERKENIRSKIPGEDLAKTTFQGANHGEGFVGTLHEKQQTGFLQTAFPASGEDKSPEELQDATRDKVEDVPASPKHPTNTTPNDAEKLKIGAVEEEGEKLEEQAIIQCPEDVKQQFAPELTTISTEQKKEKIESHIPEEALTKITFQDANHDELFMGTLCQKQRTGYLESAKQKTDEGKLSEELQDCTQNTDEDVPASPMHPTNSTASETEKPQSEELENIGAIGKEGAQVEIQAVTQFAEVAKDQFAPELTSIPVQETKANVESKTPNEELAESTYQGANHGEAIMGTLCEIQQNSFLQTATPKPNEDKSHKEVQGDTCNNVQDVPVSPKHTTNSTASETEKLATGEFENIGAIGKDGKPLQEQVIARCPEDAKKQFVPKLATMPLEHRKESIESYIPIDNLTKSKFQEANHREVFMGTLCEEHQRGYQERTMQNPDEDKSYEELQEDTLDKAEDVPNHPTNSTASETEKAETEELKNMGERMEEQVAKDQFVPELTRISVKERKENIQSKIAGEELPKSTCQGASHGEGLMGTLCKNQQTGLLETAMSDLGKDESHGVLQNATHDKVEDVPGSPKHPTNSTASETQKLEMRELDNIGDVIKQGEQQKEQAGTQCLKDVKEQFAPELTTNPLEQSKENIESQIPEEELTKSPCQEANHDEAFMGTLCQEQQTGYLESAMQKSGEDKSHEELQDGALNQVDDVPVSPKHLTNPTASETESQTGELENIGAIGKEGAQMEEQSVTQFVENAKNQFAPAVTSTFVEETKEKVECKIPEEELAKSTCQGANYDEAFMGTICQKQRTAYLESAMQQPDEDKSHGELQDGTHNKVEDVPVSPKHLTNSTTSETEKPETEKLENIGANGREGVQLKGLAISQFPEAAKDQFVPELMSITAEERKETIQSKIAGDELARSICQRESFGEDLMGTLCEKQPTGFLETAIPETGKDNSHGELQDTTRVEVEDVRGSSNHPTNSTPNETEKLEIGAVEEEAGQLEEQAITQCPEDVKQQFAPELTTIPLEEKKEKIESHIPEEELTKSTCQEANHDELFMGTLCQKQQTSYLESAMQKTNEDKSREELQDGTHNKDKDVHASPMHPTNFIASETEKSQSEELENMGAMGKEGAQTEIQAVTQFAEVAKYQFAPDMTSVPVEDTKENVESKIPKEELAKSTCQGATHGESIMGTLCETQQNSFLETALPKPDEDTSHKEVQEETRNNVQDVPVSPKHATKSTASETEKLATGELENIGAIGKEEEPLQEQVIAQCSEDAKEQFVPKLATMPLEHRKESIESHIPDDRLTKSKCQEANHGEVFMGNLCEKHQTGYQERVMQNSHEDKSHEELQEDTLDDKAKDVPNHPTNSTANETEKPEMEEEENMGAIGKEGEQMEEQVTKDQFVPELTSVPVEERKENIQSRLAGEELAKSTCQGANHGEGLMGTLCERQQTGFLETDMPERKKERKSGEDDSHEKLQDSTRVKVEDFSESPNHPTMSTTNETEKLEIRAVEEEALQLEEQAITQCSEDVKKQFAPELTTIPLEQKKEKIESQIPEEELTKSTCQEANHDEAFIGTLCQEQWTGYMESAMQKTDEDKSREEQDGTHNKDEDVPACPMHILPSQ